MTRAKDVEAKELQAEDQPALPQFVRLEKDTIDVKAGTIFELSDCEQHYDSISIRPYIHEQANDHWEDTSFAVETVMNNHGTFVEVRPLDELYVTKAEQDLVDLAIETVKTLEKKAK